MPAQFPDVGFTNPTLTLPAEAADPDNGVPAPLAAKAVTIKTLSDAGTWGHQHSSRGSVGNVRMSWDAVDDWRVRKALLGYSYVATVSGVRRLHRVTPLRWPGFRSKAYAREVKFVGAGRKSSQPQNLSDFEYVGHPDVLNKGVTVGGVYMGTDGWPTGERVVYDVTFAPPEYMTVGGTDAAAWAATAGELTRYVQGKRSPKPQEMRIPGSGNCLRFDSDSAAAPIGTPIVVNVTEYVYTWFQIPIGAIPETALRQNIGKVNSAVFDGAVFTAGGVTPGFPVATMLFWAWSETSPYRGQDGGWYVDLSYVFRERGGKDTKTPTPNDITWDKFPRPNGDYELAYREGQPGVRLYPRADHNDLFKVA